MSIDSPPDELAADVRGSWFRFIATYEPLRPELYRYCRYLTRSPWDAEDLAQDTMARAFVTLGRMGTLPEHPRAWLLRVASNLWIDRARRERPAVGSHEPPTSTEPGDPRASREAAGTLLAQLSPQERAAVVLKDVFDLSLDEVASALGTTPGAVKAALHRGRGRLAGPSDDHAVTRVAPPPALDAFCAAFNARDLDRLTALLLDTVTVDVVGMTTAQGPDGARREILPGMLFGSAFLATLPIAQGALPTPPRAELRAHRDEWLMLLWYAHTDGEAVRAINRVHLEEGRIAQLANYFYNPDLIAEVCRELGIPSRGNGYAVAPCAPEAR